MQWVEFKIDTSCFNPAIVKESQRTSYIVSLNNIPAIGDFIDFDSLYADGKGIDGIYRGNWFVSKREWFLHEKNKWILRLCLTNKK